MRLLLLLILFPTSVVALDITEIMYNPAGSDNNFEYVEVYSEEPINLTSWFIADETSEDILIPLLEIYSSYALIVEEGFNYSGINSSIYSAGAAIGNNLGNTQDTIFIKDQQKNIQSNVSYSSTLGGSGNGNSICIINNSWQECQPTPGRVNLNVAESSNIKLQTYLPEQIYVDQQYDNLFKISISGKNCSEKENVSVNYRILKSNILIKEDYFMKDIGCSGYSKTGTFIPLEEGNYTLCGIISSNQVCANFIVLDSRQILCNVSLNLSTSTNRTYLAGQSIKFTPKALGAEFPYLIEYWIEDLFGRPYKAKINTSNSNQKSWKCRIEEEDRILLLKSIVHPSCNDTNRTDNFAQEIFYVIKSGVKRESSLQIEKLYLGNDNSAEWGDQFTVKTTIFKGDESKYSVQLWAEKSGNKISPITKFNLYDKFKEYSLTLPIQLDANCNQKTEDGKAIIKLRAFGLSTEHDFEIEGIDNEICKDYKKEAVSTSSKSKQILQITDFPASVEQKQPIMFKLQVFNDDKEHQMRVWAYLYRGKKCYSCAEGSKERDDNQQSITVLPEEAKLIDLYVVPDQSIGPGKYKLKVRVIKDQQKTPKEFTQEIEIKSLEIPLLALSSESFGENTDPIGLAAKKESLAFLRTQKGIVVYESNSTKAKKLIPWLLLLSFIMLIICLWLNK